MSNDGGRPAWYQPVRNRFQQYPSAIQTAILLAFVILVAAALRFLLPAPPGFSHEEATVALAAQRIERGHIPIYFHQEGETVEPAFAQVVAVTSNVAGWGVEGPRLAATLLGILAVAGCTLWYLRTLGPLWGTIGGLLVAVSFWQLVFSRQAVPAIMMAAVAGFGLYALHQATGKPIVRGRFRMPSAWYGVAGLLFGLGFSADITMRAIVPVMLVIGGMLYLGRTGIRPAADRRGLLLGLVVMVLMAAPLASWFWQHPDVFRLGFKLPDSPRELLAGAWDTISALLRQGAADRPLLDPLLAAWFVIGLAVATRLPVRVTDAVALAWLVLFLIAVIMITPGDHSQLLVLTPVLYFFPLRAMQTVTRYRIRRLPGWTLPVIVGLSLTASAIWSISGYAQWTSDSETYRTMAGDVGDAVEALEQLPPDGHLVYFATGDHGRTVRFLAPERTRRDFHHPDILPLPAAGTAWLIVPASAGVPEILTVFISNETLAETIHDPDGNIAARVWLVDNRTRDRLPITVPTIRFEGGPTLVGYEILAAPDDAGNPAAEIVQVYQMSPGQNDVRSLARLFGAEGDISGPDGPWIQPAPDRIDTGDELLLTWTLLQFPGESRPIADLQTAIQNLDGEYLPHSRQDPESDNEEPWAYLNTIGYIGPEQ